uniref:Uncharacterized protein n=1 Tax=Leersia perrieri TaxID=77586 RepID=A0A0D9XCI4_9ORYZ
MKQSGNLGAVLVGGDADELGGRISMSNYRVICVLYKQNPQSQAFDVCSFIFDSGNNGRWRVGGKCALTGVLMDLVWFAGQAAGSLYWRAGPYSMLALNECASEFSIVMFPDHMREWSSKSKFRVVNGDGDDNDEVRVVGLSTDHHLRVFSREPISGNWVLKNTVDLSKATLGLPGRKEMYFGCGTIGKFVGGGKGYFLLSPSEEMWFYSVDLKTMVVEREHERNMYGGAAYSCELPWPPVFKACTSDDKYPLPIPWYGKLFRRYLQSYSPLRLAASTRKPVPYFRVTCVLYESHDGVSSCDGDLGTVTASVFYSERWRCGQRRWGSAVKASGLYLPGAESVHFVGRDLHRLCWRMDNNNDDMLVHMNNLFSKVALPEAMKGGSRSSWTAVLYPAYGLSGWIVVFSQSFLAVIAHGSGS